MFWPMMGLFGLLAIQLSQHEPRLHEVVPIEYAWMPPKAPQFVVSGRSPTMTSGLFPLNVQAAVQHEFVPPFCDEPSSQSSEGSRTPSPQTAAADDTARSATTRKTKIVETELTRYGRTEVIPAPPIGQSTSRFEPTVTSEACLLRPDAFPSRKTRGNIRRKLSTGH